MKQLPILIQCILLIKTHDLTTIHLNIKQEQFCRRSN